MQKKKTRLHLYNLLFSSAYKIWLRLLVSTTISGTTRSHFQPIHIGAVIARISVSVKFFDQVFFEKRFNCLVHGFLFSDSAPVCDISPGRKSHIAFPVHTTTKKTIDGDVPRLQTVRTYVRVCFFLMIHFCETISKKSFLRTAPARRSAESLFRCRSTCASAPLNRVISYNIK